MLDQKSRPVTEVSAQSLSPSFLGAHRYTTFGGTVRPAGGVRRTAVVCRGQPKGVNPFGVHGTPTPVRYCHGC